MLGITTAVKSKAPIMAGKFTYLVLILGLIFEFRANFRWFRRMEWAL